VVVDEDDAPSATAHILSELPRGTVSVAGSIRLCV
jgi:hypothetical protein